MLKNKDDDETDKKGSSDLELSFGKNPPLYISLLNGTERKLTGDQVK